VTVIAEILADTTARMDRAVEAAKDDFATVRTGRANPQLFQKILVDYYGSPTPLAQLGHRDAHDVAVVRRVRAEVRHVADRLLDGLQRRLVVRGHHERARFGGVQRGQLRERRRRNIVRVTMPELTAERRKEYVKLVRSKGEDAKVHLRGIRRKSKDELDALKSEVG
jgi:ribosome recycling factor